MGRSAISAAARAVLAACMFSAGAASAADNPGTDAAAPPVLTAADAEAYLDGFMPYALKSGDIAGAVVVVVKDGQVLLEKGYGVSDVEHQSPVDPKTTLFRPGSVSKLFTWTAVMQLVEQGKLDLDKDVNAYLDFQIPATWSKPITLRNIMTHTSGFEETVKNLIGSNPQTLMKLDAQMKSWVPERIFPPGEVSAYSNYAASLAGYIVQRVSGQSFDDYVAQHIFQPLGMVHSSMAQPLPDALAKLMSKGYTVASEKPVDFELVGPAPAGSLSSSGDDMAHFMIAHLADGAYGDTQILKPETAQLMHKTAYTPVPPLPGMALGFYHEDRNGHVVVGHAGDTDAFHSDLHLVLDAHVGLFLSMNSAGKEGAAHGMRGALYRDFMDRYFPAPAAPEQKTLASAVKDGQVLVGSYQTTRRSESNFIRLVSVLGGPANVTEDADGTVVVSELKDPAGTPKHWREVAPFVWQDTHSHSQLAAVVKDGKVEKLTTDDIPPVFYLEPIESAAAAGWNKPLLGATMAVLALAVLIWPLTAFLRWRYQAPSPFRGGQVLVYRLSRGVALIDLVFLAGWCGVLVYGLQNLDVFTNAYDPLLRLLQLIGLVGVIGTVLPLWSAVQAWTSPVLRWWTKLFGTLLAAACLATIWFAFSQRLLSLGLNY